MYGAIGSGRVCGQKLWCGGYGLKSLEIYLSGFLFPFCIVLLGLFMLAPAGAGRGYGAGRGATHGAGHLSWRFWVGQVGHVGLLAA